MLVYLAGPIRGLTVKASRDWREWAACELRESGITCLDPLRAKPWLKDDTLILDAYPAQALGSGPAILTRDFFDVRRCDLVLAYLSGAAQVSIGTVMEIASAYTLGKPIVLVLEKGDLHDHAMLIATTPFITDDLDKALALVKGILLP